MFGKALKKIRQYKFIIAVVAVLATAATFYPQRQAQAICVPVTIPCISPYTFSANSMIAAALPDLLQALLDAEIELVTNQLMPQFDPTDANSFYGAIIDRLTGLPSTGDPLQGAVYRVQGWWHAWWFYDMWPMLQDRAAQYTVMEMDQARQIGAFIDAQERQKFDMIMSEREIDSNREHRPSNLVCVAGTNAQPMMRARTIAKHFATARTREDILYSGNYDGQPNENGSAQHLTERWNHYCTNYADATSNFSTSGCAALGTTPREDLEYARLILLHDTIEYTDTDTALKVEDMKRNMIEPFATDRIPLEVFASTMAKNAWMERRKRRAQRNAAYDAFNFMIARRVPGSGDDTALDEIRTQYGMNTASFSPNDNPSYHEVMKILTSERFKTKEFHMSLLTEPENLERELLNMNALQLVQTSDILDVTDRLNVLMAIQTARTLNGTRVITGRGAGTNSN